MNTSIRKIRTDKRQALLALVFSLSISFSTVTLAENNNIVEVQRQELESFLYFKYYPRFNFADCRFVVLLKKKSTEDFFEVFDVMDIFERQILETEPTAAAHSYVGSNSPRGHMIEITFLDRCDEGERLINSGLHKAQQTEPIDFEILEKDTKTRNRTERGSLWLDSEKYDAVYWDLRRSTYESCDAKDWLNLAEYEWSDDPRQNAMVGELYTTYALLLSPQDREVTNRLLKFRAITSQANTRKADRLANHVFEQSGCR